MSRSTGRSAVAAAAYRAAVRLVNARDGVIHDYRGRAKDIAACGILAPDHAPDWAGDRGKLWDAAEAAENRRNSVTAREVQLSLPHELTLDQRLDLVQEFCASLVERYGVAVDFAIHRPDAKGDNRNHHAHVLMTARRMEADKLGEKTRELDDRTKGSNNGPSRGSQQIEYMRRTWCDMENRALERAGRSERVDHRSYLRQEIDREPEPRLGPHAHAMQERGALTLKGEWRNAVRAGDELGAEQAAILYHVRQVETHDTKLIPERGRSPKGRQWPYEAPPRPPRSLKGPTRGFTAQARQPDALRRPGAGQAPTKPRKPLPLELQNYVSRPLAKSWSGHYQQTRDSRKQLTEVHAWQREQAEERLKVASYTPATQRGGISGFFQRATVSRSEVEAQRLQREQIAERARAQLAALEKKQEDELATLAVKERERRKALARQFAKAARESERDQRDTGRIRLREDDQTHGLERVRERDRVDELRRRKRLDHD